jgi:hypothetical protein
VRGLATQLGAAATFSLVLGRASPRNGRIFYDDGDELIQLDSRSIPIRLVIIETTGSFTDWTTPFISLLPQCLARFRTHLEKAFESGVPPQVLKESVALFAEALRDQLRSIQELTFAHSSEVRHLFDDRPQEQGGIRHRWEGIMARLLVADPQELYDYTVSSSELRLER